MEEETRIDAEIALPQASDEPVASVRLPSRSPSDSPSSSPPGSKDPTIFLKRSRSESRSNEITTGLLPLVPSDPVDSSFPRKRERHDASPSDAIIANPPAEVSWPVPDIVYPERPRSPLNYEGTTWTWEDTKKDLSNFKRPVFYSKNLPHAFQDHLNSLGKSFQQHFGLQICFEGMIRENTSYDEPHAPLIKVRNNVDEEATPPWEFHYSNHMWLGEGVPPPDLTELAGCDCIGTCKPDSTTCVCVQRQRRYSEDTTAFAYDKCGKLKLEEGYPIFECNDLCLCDDHCTNRVVQHGRKCEIEIIKTLDRGWGVFAGKNAITKGTFIGVYAGELLTDGEADERGRYYNKFGRTYLFNLDFHHLKGEDPDTWDNKYVVDAYHAGNFTRFLNHSCDPNCVTYATYINDSNIHLPLLTIFALRDIDAGEELCFSYSGPPDESDLAERAVADTADLKNDAIYTECRCGAPFCTKIMFK